MTERFGPAPSWISQREEPYVLFLKGLILRDGGRAWTYREGKARDLYVMEFSRAFLDGHVIRTHRDVVDYVRGYFAAKVESPLGRALILTCTSLRKTCAILPSSEGFSLT